MERESFVFYKSFYRAIQRIKDKEERLKAYEAIVAYGITGELPTEDDGDAGMVFVLVQPQIDANNKKYVDGHKGGRPPKTWDNSQKPLVSDKKTTGCGNGKPNVNDNVNENENDNVNENENEKGYGEKHDADVTLDANASRGKKLGDIQEKKGKREVESETLKGRLLNYGLNEDIVELAVIYNGCKKGKKLSKFDDKQLGIRVNKLKRCGYDTNEGMKQVLENSIAGGYEGIFELKQPIKPVSKYGNEGDVPKVIEKGGYYFYNV